MPNDQDLLREIIRHPLTWLFSGGGATLLVQGFLGRRKAVAEAKQTDAGAEVTLSGGAIAFANDLRKDIDALQRRVENLEGENRSLYRRVAELEVESNALRIENKALRTEVSRLRAGGERLD